MFENASDEMICGRRKSEPAPVCLIKKQITPVVGIGEMVMPSRLAGTDTRQRGTVKDHAGA